jgi:hypothetical protein
MGRRTEKTFPDSPGKVIYFATITDDGDSMPKTSLSTASPKILVLFIVSVLVLSFMVNVTSAAAYSNGEYSKIFQVAQQEFLRQKATDASPGLIRWRNASLDMPVPVYATTDSFSYWIVRVLNNNTVVGYFIITPSAKIFLIATDVQLSDYPQISKSQAMNILRSNSQISELQVTESKVELVAGKWPDLYWKITINSTASKSVTTYIDGFTGTSYLTMNESSTVLPDSELVGSLGQATPNVVYIEKKLTLTYRHQLSEGINNQYQHYDTQAHIETNPPGDCPYCHYYCAEGSLWMVMKYSHPSSTYYEDTIADHSSFVPGLWTPDMYLYQAARYYGFSNSFYATFVTYATMRSEIDNNRPFVLHWSGHATAAKGYAYPTIPGYPVYVWVDDPWPSTGANVEIQYYGSMAATFVRS